MKVTGFLSALTQTHQKFLPDQPSLSPCPQAYLRIPQGWEAGPVPMSLASGSGPSSLPTLPVGSQELLWDEGLSQALCWVPLTERSGKERLEA